MLQAIVCIGETLEQREAGELWNVLEGQLNAVADKLSTEDWDSVVVAYEPVRRCAYVHCHCCDDTVRCSGAAVQCSNALVEVHREP
jgi:Triosephosphate isomerase